MKPTRPCRIKGLFIIYQPLRVEGVGRDRGGKRRFCGPWLAARCCGYAGPRASVYHPCRPQPAQWWFLSLSLKPWPHPKRHASCISSAIGSYVLDSMICIENIQKRKKFRSMCSDGDDRWCIVAKIKRKWKKKQQQRNTCMRCRTWVIGVVQSERFLRECERVRGRPQGR